MTKAVWNGAVIAESDRVETVENNVYFPLESINQEYFRPSDTRTRCPWKGTASYYDIVVNGAVNRNAAWYYPQPTPAARKIVGHVAFWKGVTVES